MNLTPNDMLKALSSIGLEGILSAGLVSSAGVKPLRRNVAIYGDSRTANCSSGTLPNKITENYGYASWLGQYSGGRILFDPAFNFGVGGDTSAQWAARVNTVIASAADVVVCLISTNDRTADFTLAQTQQNIENVVAKLKAAGKIVVFIAETPRGGANALTAPRQAIHDQTRAWIKSYLPKLGVRVVDCYDLLLDTAAVTVDGLHPNPAGARIIGQALAREIQDLFDSPAILPRYSSTYNSSTNPFGQLTNGANFITALQAPIQTVNGYTGDVDLVPADLGLGNVDNTSDINKPTSTAQQTSIDLKMSQHNAAGDPHPQYTTTAEASAAAPVQTVNGLTGAVVITTGNIAEVGNLFYTDGRVQAYITGAGYNVKSVASVGAGAPVYQSNTSGAVTLRSIIGTGAINITQNTNDITIFTSIVNSGVGQGVVKGTITGVTTMKGITAGRGMTVTSNTDDVQVSSTQFPLIYNASGQAASPKIWYGTVTSDANGDFTVNYATAGFTIAPVVTATARLSTGVIIDRAWATLNTAPTTTTAAGYTLRGNPVSGSGDSVRFAPNVTVMIMAVGI